MFCPQFFRDRPIKNAIMKEKNELQKSPIINKLLMILQIWRQMNIIQMRKAHCKKKILIAKQKFKWHNFQGDNIS